jgi:hypothetical protein
MAEFPLPSHDTRDMHCLYHLVPAGLCSVSMRQSRELSVWPSLRNAVSYRNLWPFIGTLYCLSEKIPEAPSLVSSQDRGAVCDSPENEEGAICMVVALDFFKFIRSIK